MTNFWKLMIYFSLSSAPLPALGGCSKTLSKTIDKLLLRYCTRFLCTFNWNLHLAKITTPPIPSQLTGCTNWSITEVQVNNLNRQEIFSCQYINVYSISLSKTMLYNEVWFQDKHSPRYEWTNKPPAGVRHFKNL